MVRGMFSGQESEGRLLEMTLEFPRSEMCLIREPPSPSSLDLACELNVGWMVLLDVPRLHFCLQPSTVLHSHDISSESPTAQA